MDRHHLRHSRSGRLCSAVLVALLLSFSGARPAPLSAQGGTITGVVSNAQTGEPLEGAQLSLETVSGAETGLGVLSGANGRFLLLNVPNGQFVLRAQLIGYGTWIRIVETTSGQLVVTDLRLEPESIPLSEIIVTGVVGATQKTKLPFEVTQVRMADLPVPALNPMQSLQGKVAGAQVVQGSGRPGSTPSVLLRGVTALDASGRSQDPLYIVDGVILGSEMVDIDALDIQSIEVVKGAAAASLYGSRAGSGVVHIRTRRGAEMADDRVRYTVRSEYGRSGLTRDPGTFVSQFHSFALTEAGDAFLDVNGEPCNWLECTAGLMSAGQTAGEGAANGWNTYQSNPWPGQTYNQLERFFTHGGFTQSHVSVEGRSGGTNFLISGSHLQQEGIFRYLRGYQRENARINLDQEIRRDFSVHASAFLSKSSQPEGQNTERTAFELFMGAAPVADLLQSDPDDPSQPVFKVGPDLTDVNPLYLLKNDQMTQDRNRFLGSTTVRYAPASWLTVEGNASFDRSDQDRQRVVPKGYKTVDNLAFYREGYLEKYQNTREALNASVTATGRWSLGDRVRNSTQLRYLMERWDQSWMQTYGFSFAAADVPTLDNLDQSTLVSGSQIQQVRSDGFFLITNFDIMDRYVLDALVRNDGSSLFGADERRQWYYRIGGAWRLSEERFFQIPGFDELKLRYSVGTAGGRPRFDAQYETFAVEGGRILPNYLGNKDLKPELSTEHEAGIDLSLLDFRALVSLTYARTTTTNQILQVPQTTYLGYKSRWMNAGTLKSRTWEATLDLRLLEREDFDWSAKLLFDDSRSTITALGVPDFRYSIGLGRNDFFARTGEDVGTFYGARVATSCANLPSALVAEGGCDEFAVNDEGYLVWVGPGGSLGAPQWGTVGPTIGGVPLYWGTPFAGYCVDRVSGEQTQYCPIGNSLPKYNLSLSSTVKWKGLSVYALFTRSAGFDIFNYTLYRSSGTLRDQGSLPLAQQKPVAYYGPFFQMGVGQAPSTAIEDGTFTKLRDLSVTYELDPGLLHRAPGLGGVEALRISVTGQNLFTWTDYRGLDPDVGESGGDVGSAVIARTDWYAYPHFRTFTTSIELVF